MQANREQFSAPSRRFILEVMLIGAGSGIVLLLLDSPLWLFYVAPLLAVPLLVHELRAIDPARRQPTDDPPPVPGRPAGGSGGGKSDAMSATPAGLIREVPTKIIWLVVFAAVLASLAFVVSNGVSHEGGGEARSAPTSPPDHRTTPKTDGAAKESPELAYGEHGRDGGNGPSEPPRLSHEASSASPPRDQKETPAQHEGAPATQEQTEAGGASSPVVPILIAVAVLAAISIGVVMYRQRREMGGRRTGDRLRY